MAWPKAPSTAVADPERDRFTLLVQIVLPLVVLALWELAGARTGSVWFSRPSLVFGALANWAGGRLLLDIATTLTEMVTGLVIGSALGTLVGLAVGRSQFARLVAPLMVGLYAVPLIALAPLIILWFGIGILPKIILVSIVVFFLLFFNAFAGARETDPDIEALFLGLGASDFERLLKFNLPSAIPRLVTGLKIATPYALSAAAAGEMLAARSGVGLVLSNAASQFDMDRLYAALVVLATIGLVASQLILLIEKKVLAWR
jgi:NitT/TauT family transport system permease protein